MRSSHKRKKKDAEFSMQMKGKMMKKNESDELIKDFILWSGGFHPSDATDKIDIYVEFAGPHDMPEEKIRKVLAEAKK